MDEFEKMIANLQRLRLDIERVAPAEPTEEIVKRIAELQRRIDSVREPKDARKQ